jgi:hypothetical protein
MFHASAVLQRALQKRRVELPFAHLFDCDTVARRLVVHALLTNTALAWLERRCWLAGSQRSWLPAGVVLTFKSVYTGDIITILVCWYHHL